MMHRQETETETRTAEVLMKPRGRGIVLIENSGEVPRLVSLRRLNSVIIPTNEVCLNAVAQAVVSSPRKAGVLVIPWLPRAEIFPVLLRGFHRILSLKKTAFTDHAQRLCEVISAGEPGRLLGIVPDIMLAAVTLFRADLSALCVPGTWFEHGEEKGLADINSLELEQDGAIVRLGSRRWPAQQVIAAFDANFRRSLRRLELAQRDTLGGLIRRMRKERRLGRAEFPGIDAKTIARIERDEIRRPQGETLRLIAQTLGLPLEQLKERMATHEAESLISAVAPQEPDVNSASA